MANTYTKIASSTVATAINTITFNSIPSTYTDLKIVYSGRTTANGVVYCDLWTNNNSTSSNYGSRFQAWNSTGSTGQSTNSYTYTYGYMSDNAWTSGYFGGGYFYIPNYNSTGILQNIYNYSAGSKNAASGSVGTLNAGYAPTGAITRIDLNIGTGTGNWAVGSEITLYGI